MVDVNEYKRRQGTDRREDHAARVRPGLAPADREPLPRTLRRARPRRHGALSRAGRSARAAGRRLCLHGEPAGRRPEDDHPRFRVPRSSRPDARTSSRTGGLTAWPTRWTGSGSSPSRPLRSARRTAAGSWAWCCRTAPRCPIRARPIWSRARSRTSSRTPRRSGAVRFRSRSRRSRPEAGRGPAGVRGRDDHLRAGGPHDRPNPPAVGSTLRLPRRVVAPFDASLVMVVTALRDVSDAQAIARTLEVTEDPQCWRRTIQERFPELGSERSIVSAVWARRRSARPPATRGPDRTSSRSGGP